MKISLRLDSDSYNSYSTEEITLVASKHTDCIVIELGDRKVSVNKEDLYGAVKLLSIQTDGNK